MGVAGLLCVFDHESSRLGWDWCSDFTVTIQQTYVRRVQPILWDRGGSRKKKGRGWRGAELGDEILAQVRGRNLHTPTLPLGC